MNAEIRPCDLPDGRTNSNRCVGEGCYSEACIRPSVSPDGAVERYLDRLELMGPDPVLQRRIDSLRAELRGEAPVRSVANPDSRTPAVVLGLGVFFCLVGLSASVVFYIGQSRGFW